MQNVTEYLRAVPEPQHVRDGATRHDRVKASHLALSHVDISWDLLKHWLVVLLGHPANPSVTPTISSSSDTSQSGSLNIRSLIDARSTPTTTWLDAQLGGR
jgi:hypothetical protein